MGEQEITFKTAVLAKERGFTLQNIGSHVYNYYQSDGSDGNISWGHLHLNDPAKAPQYLLQQWLNLSHKLFVSVIPTIIEYNKKPDEIKWSYRIYNLEEFLIKGKSFGLIESGVICPNTYNETYEEALEDGLKEALKLI